MQNLINSFPIASEATNRIGITHPHINQWTSENSTNTNKSNAINTTALWPISDHITTTTQAKKNIDKKDTTNRQTAAT